MSLPIEKRPKQIPRIKIIGSGDVSLAYHPNLIKKSFTSEDSFSISINEGDNYFSMGDYEKAISCYNKAY